MLRSISEPLPQALDLDDAGRAPVATTLAGSCEGGGPEGGALSAWKAPEACSLRGRGQPHSRGMSVGVVALRFDPRCVGLLQKAAQEDAKHAARAKAAATKAVGAAKQASSAATSAQKALDS